MLPVRPDRESVLGVNAHGFLDPSLPLPPGLAGLVTESPYNDSGAWHVESETMIAVSDAVNDATRIATFVSAGEDLE